VYAPGWRQRELAQGFKSVLLDVGMAWLTPRVLMTPTSLLSVSALGQSALLGVQINWKDFG
jgi:hypothetical protein